MMLPTFAPTAELVRWFSREGVAYGAAARRGEKLGIGEDVVRELDRMAMGAHDLAVLVADLAEADLVSQIRAALERRFVVQIDGTQVHSAAMVGDTIWTDCGVTNGRRVLRRVEGAVTCARCARKLAKMRAQVAEATSR